MMDIYQRLWDEDENRCSVSGRAANNEWVDASADILLDVQARASGKRNLDLATKPLFFRVNEDKLKLPTYARFIDLLDNYVANVREEEEESAEERAEINAFLDEVMKTRVASVALEYLRTELGEALSAGQLRALLNTVWFELYTNFFGNKSTEFASGFEHVFVGEAKYDTRFGGEENLGEISGYHSWVKFYLDESRQRVNFLGYKFDLRGGEGPDNPDVVTLQMLWNLADMNGTVVAQLFKKKGGFFVGPSPECLIVMGAVAYLESVHGRLSNDRRRARIGVGDYNLVMYRSTTAQGSRGEYIRSFYPEYLGKNEVRDADVDRPHVTRIGPEGKNTGPVAIASLLPNPSGEDDGNEWIELKNTSGGEISLSGWELRDRVGRPLALSGSIAASAVTRIMVAARSPSSLQLGNAGGFVSLHDGEGAMIAGVNYGKAASGQVVRYVA